MAARRVYVIWTHPLFHESVRLLLNHPGVKWVGATSDYSAARDDLLKLKPDTILIEEIGGAIRPNLSEILEICSWDSRIIGLNLENNQLSVYHRKQRTVGQAEDLLHLIQDDLS